MSSLRALARVLCAASLFAFFAPSAARAISMDKASTIRDQCEISIGPDLIGVVAYMPDRSRDRFCAEFPATGRIILTVDLIAERLRQLPIEVRIVKEPGKALSQEDDLAPFTVAYLAPRLYPGGAVPVEHVFNESGNYAAFVSVIESSGARRATRFGFTVGGWLQFYATAMLAGVFLAGAVFAYWQYSNTGVKGARRKPR
ncbi:hypothetical protein ACNHKD_14045 [Methylocystis sp. JAN1]|uniref:hypothetical protein n=1 Tax=Methylocystis sp. JAN1 TaxID=3397211 RepID=UPI003FA1B94C